MEITLCAIGLIFAYLLGSIPTAVWVGKAFYGIDVRDQGSGNAGATNTIRVLGIKAGIPVIVVDVLKGWLAVWMMHFFINENWNDDLQIYLLIVSGILAVVGHALPVFAGFRGGKGVATLLGVGIALYGWAVVLPVLIFVIVIWLTRFVSLGSILAGLSFPLGVLFLFQEKNSGLIFLSLFVSLFIIWTHRKNIQRLLRGKENRFSFSKNKSNEK